MAKNNALIGLTFAFISVVAFSIVYVFSKAALNEVSLAQFGVYWFTVALIENGIYFFAAGLFKKFWQLPAKKRWLIVLISFFELVGTVMFFWSIKLFRNPAAVSFISTLIPIFVGILSFIFLRERFNFLESTGIVLTIVGAMIISYQSATLGEIEHAKLGLFVAFGFVLIFAVNTILMRVAVRDAHPVMISLMRSVFLLTFWVIVLIINGESLKIPGSALKNILIGATLGPFIGLLASVFALKYIEATITSVIINAKGFLILLIAYWYLNLEPEPYQIYGGLLAVAGVAILSYGKYLKEKRQSSN